MNPRHHYLVVPATADPFVIDASNWLAAAGLAMTRLGRELTGRIVAQVQDDESAVIEDLTSGERLVLWKGTPVRTQEGLAAH